MPMAHRNFLPVVEPVAGIAETATGAMCDQRRERGDGLTGVQQTKIKFIVRL